MDRLAAHVVATAVLTAALAAVPTAMANPDTSTPPAAAKPAHKPTSASAPMPCADAHQTGNTSYARWHGIVAFSVKQFYSPGCHAVYGYAFPWLQFRLLKIRYDLGMGVFDTTHDAIDGARTFVGGAGGPDFWSSPVAVPKGTCTQGLAHVFFPDIESDTFTTKYCA